VIRTLTACAARICAAFVLVVIGGLAPRASALPAQQVVTLEEALESALSRSPTIEAADATAAAASSARWADWGAFLPTIRANVDLSSTDFTNVTYLTPEGSPAVLDPPLTDVSKGSNAALSFSLPLLNPERIAAVGAGGSRKDAAWLRLTAAERTVIRDVKRAYFEALKQRRLLEVAQRQLEARRVDLEVTQERYRIAAASRSDLLGAEIDASDAELRVLQAEDGLAAAVRALQVAMANPVSIQPELVALVDVEEVPRAEFLDAASLVRAAHASNPTLAALLKEEDAASSDLWAARASYLPRIDLGFVLGRSKQLGREESLFDFEPANTRSSFQIVGSWNLFQGFERKRQTAEASGRVQRARAEWTANALQLDKDVRDLVQELKRRDRRLTILVRNRDLADERLELAREQYRLGSIPYFNLQQAIDRTTQAEQSLFTERYDYLIRWAELEERVGPALADAALASAGTP
jgi:outer membrane protein TolC